MQRRGIIQTGLHSILGIINNYSYTPDPEIITDEIIKFYFDKIEMKSNKIYIQSDLYYL